MLDDRLQYRASYLYPDNSVLERALAAALDVDERARGFLRVFVTHGNELNISATMPDTKFHRSAATRMFRCLEAEALRASVRCDCAGREVEIHHESMASD